MKRDEETCEMVPCAVHKRCKVAILASGLSTTLSLIFSGLIPGFRVHASYANVLVCVKLNFFYLCDFPH